MIYKKVLNSFFLSVLEHKLLIKNLPTPCFFLGLHSLVQYILCIEFPNMDFYIQPPAGSL